MNGGIFIQVLILGSDPRFKVLVNELSKKYSVDVSDFIVDIKKYDMIILPMKGVNREVLELLKNSKETCIIYTGLIGDLKYLNRKVISFLDDEDIKEENDNITVDGIMDYIKDINYHNVCILGYGHIGRKLYKRLVNAMVGVIDEIDKSELGDKGFLTTDKDKMKEVFNSSDLIINTVPKNIIGYDMVKNLKGMILDIASKPYGINQDIVKNSNLNYYLYSGIPSRYDPERAGKILLKKFM